MRRSFLKLSWLGLTLALGAGGTFVAGCPSTRSISVEPIRPGQIASALVGPEGATLEVGTMEVVIPAGALTGPQEIRVIVDATPAPTGFTGFSPVVRFEPEGTAFARPVQVRIPFEGDARLATIFWSQREGEAFVPRATRVADGYAIAETTHFSRAFVGTACEGADCCDAANGELDLLLMVDSSGSMAEEQALLREQLPRLVRVLASGDRDGDGVQDFPALSSVQIGVITPDLGSGSDASVPTCAPGWGEDGLLRTRARSGDPACDGIPMNGILRYEESDPAPLDSFVTHAGCLADVGTDGCGFEQPLEAMLLALSPSAPTDYTAAGWSPPIFPDGRTGHGDGAHAGFVRSGSMLAIVHVTDEDDLSALDTGVFDPSDPRFVETPLNLRGYLQSDPAMGIVHPVSRYVDGLAGLRAQSADLIFGLVAGVPSGVIEDPASVDYAALLGHAAMRPVVNAAGTGLEPSCASINGVAFPPTRLVETASELDARGAGTVVASICDPSFDALLDGLIERISRRAAGRCD
ncbi:MAG: hypothetical protein OHK0013_15520 [Sandaracinaceae bacterium]